MTAPQCLTSEKSLAKRNTQRFRSSRMSTSRPSTDGPTDCSFDYPPRTQRVFPVCSSKIRAVPSSAGSGHTCKPLDPAIPAHLAPPRLYTASAVGVGSVSAERPRGGRLLLHFCWHWGRRSIAGRVTIQGCSVAPDTSDGSSSRLPNMRADRGKEPRSSESTSSARSAYLWTGRR